MVKQEQLSDENKKERKESYSIKSMIVKLFFILLLGSVACWFYMNPDVLKNIKQITNNNQHQEQTVSMQISQLQNQVASLQAQILNIPAPDFSMFENKVASLEKQNLNVIDSKADASIVLGMLTRVDKLENRLDKLSKISDDGALILSATMLVKEAAEDGDDFIYEAEVLNQLTENNATIKKDVSVIAEFSRNGVVSEKELMRKFNLIYENILQEAKPEAKNWKERFNNKLNEYVKISKIGENTPKTEQGNVLNEILALIDEGKLTKAIKLIESSDSDVISQNQDLQGWLADAQNLVNFNQSVRNIAAYCLAEMKVNNLKNKE